MQSVNDPLTTQVRANSLVLGLVVASAITVTAWFVGPDARGASSWWRTRLARPMVVMPPLVLGVGVLALPWLAALASTFLIDVGGWGPLARAVGSFAARLDPRGRPWFATPCIVGLVLLPRFLWCWRRESQADSSSPHAGSAVDTALTRRCLADASHPAQQFWTRMALDRSVCAGFHRSGDQSDARPARRTLDRWTEHRADGRSTGYRSWRYPGTGRRARFVCNRGKSRGAGCRAFDFGSSPLEGSRLTDLATSASLRQQTSGTIWHSWESLQCHLALPLADITQVQVNACPIISIIYSNDGIERLKRVYRFCGGKMAVDGSRWQFLGRAPG